jgi:hypothetical protein
MKRLPSIIGIAVVALAVAPHWIAAQTPAAAQAPTTAAPAPALSLDDFEKLKRVTIAGELAPPPFNPALVHFFSLGDEGETVNSKQYYADSNVGKHLIDFSLKEGRDDVLVTFKGKGTNYFFLTNSTRQLRAAAVLDLVLGLRPLSDDVAAQAFQAQLSIWAKVATDVHEDPAKK